jgi:hypothetical protein
MPARFGERALAATQAQRVATGVELDGEESVPARDALDGRH